MRVGTASAMIQPSPGPIFAAHLRANPPHMSVYDELGVRTIINAAGPLTRLSGSRLEPEVLAAMAEAAGWHVRIEDLQERAGAVIAELTGAEAGYVTSGAAAGLALGAAACVAGLDVAKM